MTLFLVLVFIAAGIAVLATLAMGLVNLTRNGPQDAEGPQPSPRSIRSNQLMQQRVLFQGIAIAALALILLFASARG